MSRLCFPYGAGIECTCDGRTKRILRCVSILASGPGKEPPPIADTYYQDPDVGSLEGPEGPGPGDERTEIILAVTFLLMVVLSFLGFLVYRCERHLLGPSSSCPARLQGHTHGSSVAIQTVPVMAADSHHYNGEILTVTRVMNGSARPVVAGDPPSWVVGDPAMEPLHPGPPSPGGHYGEIRTISRAVGAAGLASSPSDPGAAQDLPRSFPSHSPPTPPWASEDPHQFRMQLEQQMVARQEADRLMVVRQEADRLEYERALELH